MRSKEHIEGLPQDQLCRGGDKTAQDGQRLSKEDLHGRGLPEQGKETLGGGKPKTPRRQATTVANAIDASIGKTEERGGGGL